MAAKDYLELQRQRVEDAIGRLLPAEGTRPAILSEAIRYSVLTGGKRLRPVLCVTASEAVAGPEGNADAALNAAVAIEFLHTYTLIHDDLPAMDDDLLRRGQPTVHAKYGEALAILAGDALQAYAFDIASRPAGLAPERALRIVRELAEAAGPAGVVGGQVEDIGAAGTLDSERLAYIQRHKTADLFRAALRMGAIAGGGDEDAIDAMGAFGNYLGIAFQIVDDLLDAPAGTDPASIDETTCLHLWTREEAVAQARLATSEAVAALSRIKGSPALAAMSSLAQSLLTRAV
ncbi:MAG: polyprenyl synthetase family protein [Kiritimatiellae bacterium]|nr:polyprenyl synthetase family protein [Kiritimatiellia bacterium]